jgi:hypothetical protein
MGSVEWKRQTAPDRVTVVFDVQPLVAREEDGGALSSPIEVEVVAFRSGNPNSSSISDPKSKPLSE